MSQHVATNSVFLPYKEEVKRYKPIVISAPSFYNPKVKIHDWQLRMLAEPRDNKTGNFGHSTYKRLGMDDDPTGISVTRAMTEQIRTKSDYDEEYRYRSLLNFYSFPITDTDEYKEAMKLIDLDLPKSIERMDYRTTLRDDYPSHYPTSSSAPRSSPISEPSWLMYRRTLGYNSHDLQRRAGISKFLDDNMEIQNCAAALKMPRFVSYDPMAREYTDSKKFSDAILKNSSINCSV